MTRRQLDALRFIARAIRQTGITPGYGDIATGLGVASKGAVARLIDNLAADGYIDRPRFRQRAITVTAKGHRHLADLSITETPVGALHRICGELQQVAGQLGLTDLAAAANYALRNLPKRRLS